MKRIAVIMAGGSGERFWPVSRALRPKQLLKLTGDQSMIQEAVDRIAPVVGRDKVLVATSRALAPAIHAALPGLPEGNIIAEPARRNTAGCLTLVAAHAVRYGDPNDVVVAVLTADHAIGEPNIFRATVARALSLAASQDVLVTLGVNPTRLETGYGYIEAGTPIADRIWSVARFHEKPSRHDAERYLSTGTFFWNSGMFFFRVSTLENALAAYLPTHSDTVDRMRRAMASGRDSASAVAAIVEEAFLKLPDVSIDKGVMERARNVAVVRADFPWDDVGEWSALLRFGAPDDEGNVIVGAAELVGCQDCVAYNASTKGQVIAAVGLKRQIIVMTDDSTMAAPVDSAQRVREIVERLRASGLTGLL